MPKERNKKKNRGLVRSRRVALRRVASSSSFLRPGTSERRTPRLREPVCGPFPPAGTKELREAIPFPTESTFEWCARRLDRVRLLRSRPGSALVGRSASNTERPPMEESDITANPKRFRILFASFTVEDDERLGKEQNKKERKRENDG